MKKKNNEIEKVNPHKSIDQFNDASNKKIAIRIDILTPFEKKLNFQNESSSIYLKVIL